MEWNPIATSDVENIRETGLQEYKNIHRSIDSLADLDVWGSNCSVKDMNSWITSRGLVGFTLVLWHINYCSLFDAKPSLYIWFVNISQQS